MEELQKQAIKAAINGAWDDAISLNKKILKEDINNVDCMLRLANAYFSTGEIKLSLNIATKAQKIDPENKLAIKFLQKCKVGKAKNTRDTVVKPNLKLFSAGFGSTKLVKLTHIGEPSRLAYLVPGEQLNLITSSKKTSLETTDKVYVGHLPDDISINIWINRDKKHEAIFKSFSGNTVEILLKES